MRDGDYWVRGMAAGGQVRAFAVRTTALAETLRVRHDAGPVGTRALGRTATAAVLLGAALKDPKEQVGVQINGSGPLGEVYAVADSEGHVRATVGDPRADAVDLPTGLGLGRFTVVKRVSEDEPAYRGTVPLVVGEIAEDLVNYFMQSEQLPTACAIGEVLGPDGVIAAGGYLIQALPGADEAALAAIEAGVLALGPVADLFAAGATPEDVLGRLLGDFEVRAVQPVAHRCTCDRARYARALVSLGQKQLQELAAEDAVTELECHFCRTKYAFDAEQMRALIYGARLHDEKMARMAAENN